jgi:hypothetical protein
MAGEGKFVCHGAMPDMRIDFHGPWRLEHRISLIQPAMPDTWQNLLAKITWD